MSFFLKDGVIHAIFSASGKKPSFTIVLFTSCERGSDIIFDASLTILAGILSKESEDFVSSLSMVFLILLPVASFKKNSDRPEECGIL